MTIARGDEIHEVSADSINLRRCVPDLLSVSPDGTTGVTTDLRVIDLATAEASPLSDTPLDNAYGYVDIHWLNDEDFLVSVPASTDNRRSSLVRCRTNELRCEAATGAVGVGDNGSALLP